MLSGPTTSPTLLSRLRNPSDNDAWAQFVSLYGPLVYRLAKKKGLQRDDADNLAQQFFLRMVKELPRFTYDPRRGRFRAWVFTVALNEVRHFLSAGAASGRREAVYRDRREEEVVQRDDPGEEALREWWGSAEATRMLQIALDRLSASADPDHVAIFTRLVFGDSPADPVAAEFGLNRNQVYGIKFRLLRRLREIAQALREEWDEFRS